MERQRMWDRAERARQMVEEKLRLFTPEIRKALFKAHEDFDDAPIPIYAGMVELVKRHPDHFWGYVVARAMRSKAHGKRVWQDPETLNFYEDIHIRYIRQYLHICLDWQSRWLQKPHSEFLNGYKSFLTRKGNREAAEAIEADENRFFNLPNAAISDDLLDNYIAYAYWSEEECVAILMGLNPTIVNLKTIEAAVGHEKSAFIVTYRISLERIKRAAEVNQLKRPISPSAYIKWAAANNITIGSQNDESSFRTAHLGKREFSKPAVHSLYKIVLGLAYTKYGLGPVEPYCLEETEAFKSMLTDLQNAIAGQNKQTLAQYLRRAFSYAREQKEGFWVLEKSGSPKKTAKT